MHEFQTPDPDINIRVERGLENVVAALRKMPSTGQGAVTAPFSGPGYLEAILRAYHADDDPTLVRAVSDNAVVGQMLLVARPLNRFGLRIEEYGFPFNPNTILNDIHVKADMSGTVAPRLLQAAFDGKPKTLILDHMPLEDGVVDALADAARALGGRADTPVEARTLYYAHLTGDYESFLVTRSRNHRWQIKKTWRKAEESGPVSVICAEGATEIANQLAAWFEVEARSWQGQSDESAMSAQDRDFHQRLLETLPADQVGRLWLVHFSDRPVAALRMIDGQGPGGRKTCVHTMHFDAAERKLAPGLIAFDAMVRHACEEGFAEIDMHGTTDFFARWATGEREHASLRVYRPGLGGQILQQARKADRWQKAQLAGAKAEAAKG